MKVGLLVIATNKYIQFAAPLYESMQKYFLNEPDVERQMFLFTNQTAFPGPVVIDQEHEPWPAMTLKRYEIILKNRRYFEDMNYLYYCDADMLFVNKVGKEILGDLVATIHPGYWNTPRENFPYETNPLSTAYIPAEQGVHYYIGSFQGGTTIGYLRMAETLYEQIEQDLSRGLIAVWHDESHLNRYLSQKPPTVELSPSYNFPEAEWGQSLPFPRKLMSLFKDQDAIRK